MRVDLFDFALPEDRIALRPARPRDAARMLVVTPPDGLADRGVRDLPACLSPGDALVVNDTRVLPARLAGVRVRGEAVARIEVTLIRREGDRRWRALARPAKRLAVGETVYFGDHGSQQAGDSLPATVLARDGGEVLFNFALAGSALDTAIERHGVMPLPPYIAGRRAEDAGDRADYQTMFARQPGAVAAPTASLHFTPELLAAVEGRGVDVHRVTLHVGAGTFLPVQSDDTDAHRMHAEWGCVTDETAAALTKVRENGGRIVAAGTTSLRILESAARADGTIAPFAGETRIFITPGYRFRAVDRLLTNFHLPRSTLFMLVAAFSGLDTMQRAYAHAIQSRYRFYSYGDACFLARAENA